eukprot:COSAG02_NODE_45292_length_358_cov_1.096525_1_plen_38_part_01
MTSLPDLIAAVFFSSLRRFALRASQRLAMKKIEFYLAR